MSPTALAALAAVVLAQATSTSQQVDRDEVLRLGNNVQKIDGIQATAANQFVGVMGPPADDNHKWFITLISKSGCPMCKRLKADLVRDPYLRSLVNVRSPKKSWSHFNSYRIEDKSQSFRWKGIKLIGFPTILVQPPLNKKYGDPATVVFQHTGYDGNGQKLASKLTSAIKQYLAKRINQPRPRAEGTARSSGHRQKVPIADDLNSIGIDPPWIPSPKIDPPNTPDLSPLVDLPQIPPLTPATPNKPTGPIGKDAEYPEAIVITDADDDLSDERASRIRKIVAALRKQRGKNLKVRLMDWRDAKDRYPVQRSEVPVILVTNNGQITDKISGQLLPFLRPDREFPSEVTIADIPWSAVVTLLTTGFSIPAALAIVFWILRFIRTRRKAAGADLLVSDEVWERIFTVADRLADRFGGDKPKAAAPRRRAKK